ncbi:TraR/DksA C4-type zinc finger protein [Streptomyces sp. MP131-18]|uniref:TraR/DksA family transcriptional regulator n=1 Tax=Streptomyces sp. MP131-18 TaxID=1857892 RepID=UPI00097C5E0C|nr:TraR/DksA C4-type zinc finger protein [Streptomyces sp. MP131-18]ONK11231.1 regulatory protein, yteA family [Streptomyces sp. MP131-18]
MSPDTSRPAAEPAGAQDTRQRLEDERDTRLAQLRALDSASDGSEADHLVVPQRSAVQRALQDIEAAFGRLDSGTYGTCLGCAGPIPAARLDILPHARYCVPCQQRAG